MMMTIVDPFQPGLEYGDVTFRTVGGRVLGVYNEDRCAYRFEDCTIRFCTDDDDIWLFITEPDRDRRARRILRVDPFP